MPHPHARTEILIGPAGLARLRSKQVFIAGLGGVGGYAAEAVARAGIGRITLLDHDTVAPSNINRQLLALHSTIGQPKAELMAARLKDINPEVELNISRDFLRPETAAEFVTSAPYDYVLDCIDSIACKAALVAACLERGIPVISALGAGNRLDVTRARVTRLKKTDGCPLARELRRRLRELGAPLDYPVVFSDEPRRQPLPHQPISGPIPGRARAVNGTISYMPALFGILLAGTVIRTLLGELEDKV